MLDCFNRPQDLRPDIAAFHALQIAPCRNPAFDESTLDRLGKLSAVRTRVRDEDPIGRELHFAIIKDSWSFVQPTFRAFGYRAVPCRSYDFCTKSKSLIFIPFTCAEYTCRIWA